jgi:sec-independent protein translocase protein TatB
VIGPKDLPKALRAVGEMVGKVRRMAGEFQGQFNDAMREAELHDLKKQVEDIGGSVDAATKVDFNPLQTIRDEIKGATTAPASSASAPAGAAAGAVAGAALTSSDPQPAVSPAFEQPAIEPPPFQPVSITPLPADGAPSVSAPAEPAPVAQKGAAS